jgi:hypothetical protein
MGEVCHIYQNSRDNKKGEMKLTAFLIIQQFGEEKSMLCFSILINKETCLLLSQGII